MPISNIRDVASAGKGFSNSALNNRNSGQNGEGFSVDETQKQEQLQPINEKNAGNNAQTTMGQKDLIPLAVTSTKNQTLAVETVKDIIDTNLLSTAKLNGYTELVGELEQLSASLYIPAKDLVKEMMEQEKQNTMFSGDKFYDLLREFAKTADPEQKEAIGNMLKAINFTQNREEITTAVSANLRFLAEYFSPNKGLSARLTDLADQWGSPDSQSNFQMLRDKTSDLMQSLSDSLLNDSHTQTLLPIITHNLSKFNTNTSMLRENFNQLLAEIPSYELRTELSKSFESLLNKLIRSDPSLMPPEFEEEFQRELERDPATSFDPQYAVNDENGEPRQGQAVQQSAANGQPVRQSAENGQPVQFFDRNGQPVQIFDRSGQPVQVFDRNGQPVQPFDANGQPIQLFDENGQPVQLFDRSGQPVQQFDENGQPMQLFDRNGQPVQQFDANSQSVRLFDRSGQPVRQLNANGQPMQQLDEDGQPVRRYLDENGQPIPYDSEEYQQTVRQDPQNVPANNYTTNEQKNQVQNDILGNEYQPDSTISAYLTNVLGDIDYVSQSGLLENDYTGYVNDLLNDNVSPEETIKAVLESLIEDEGTLDALDRQMSNINTTSQMVDFLNSFLEAMPNGTLRDMVYEALEEAVAHMEDDEQQYAPDGEQQQGAQNTGEYGGENGQMRTQQNGQNIPQDGRIPYDRMREQEMQNIRDVQQRQAPKKSSSIQALTDFVEKNINHPALKSIDSFNASNLLQSMINAPGVMTPLAHYILPVQIENTHAFGELWVDNNDESGSTGSAPGVHHHLFLTFDVDTYGRFEVDVYANDKTVRVNLLHPSSFTRNVGEIVEKVNRIAAGTKYAISDFSTGVLKEPHNLTQIFPKLQERRAGLNVKA